MEFDSHFFSLSLSPLIYCVSGNLLRQKEPPETGLKILIENKRKMVHHWMIVVNIVVWSLLLSSLSVLADDEAAAATTIASAAALAIDCDCHATALESIATACCINEMPFIASEMPANQITFRNIRNASAVIQLMIHSTANFTEIPPQIIDTFVNVQYLELKIGLERFIFGQLPPKLKHLNLNDNRITAIDTNTFRGALEIEQITAQFNQIATIDDRNAFVGLAKLKHLIFYNNKLRELKRTMFLSAMNLESIDVSCNEIETIEDGTFNLPHLKELLMSENKLKTLSDTIFRGAGALQNIDLQKNQLERIGQAFDAIGCLHQLQLTENRQLKDLDVLGLVSKLPVLHALSVDATGITTLGTAPAVNASGVPNFGFQSPLHTFSVSQNHLVQTDFLRQLSVFPKLEKLFVDANHFTRWDDGDVKNIKKFFPYIELIVTKSNQWDRRWVESTLIPVFQSNQIFCSNIKYLNTYIEGFTNSIDGKIIEGTECI